MTEGIWSSNQLIVTVVSVTLEVSQINAYLSPLWPTTVERTYVQLMRISDLAPKLPWNSQCIHFRVGIHLRRHFCKQHITLTMHLSSLVVNGRKIQVKLLFSLAASHAMLLMPITARSISENRQVSSSTPCELHIATPFSGFHILLMDKS